ncbi:MAG: hypothetical protein LBS74_05185 [Oscillospiraceae bacterium]|jgi:hypothetical protein|nr:hypothetical protein [Oscillospiraceae bacterium]
MVELFNKVIEATGGLAYIDLANMIVGGLACIILLIKSIIYCKKKNIKFKRLGWIILVIICVYLFAFCAGRLAGQLDLMSYLSK